MMTNARRGHVLAAALAATVFLSAGCSGKSDKRQDDKKEAGKNGEDKRGDDKTGGDNNGVGDAKPDFSLTAKVLCEEHEKTPQNAFNTKYEGKVVEVTGLVCGVGRNTSDAPYLLVAASADSLEQVQCFTAKEDPWGRVAPGQTVKLKGRCEHTGLLTLSGCVILEASGPEAVAVTAQQLVQEYEADPKGASDKYKGRHLKLSGEVLKTAPVEGKSYSRLTMKTSGKKGVACYFMKVAEDPLKDLRTGQRVTVLGRFDQETSPTDFELFGCVLFKQAP